MRTILYFTRLGLKLFVGRLVLINFKRKRKTYESDEKYIKDLYVQFQKYANFTVNTTGSNITVVGRENIILDRSVLFTPNHQSFFDIPTMLSAVDKPITFISKKDILKIPVISPAMREFNCLTLDRENVKEAMKTVVEAIKLLKKGEQSLVIFPEGTRSRDGKVSEFKDGAFKIGAKAKVPIIPVTIQGTRDIMEANGNRIKPNNITITFHEPIETENLTKEEIKELPKKIHDIVSM